MKLEIHKDGELRIPRAALCRLAEIIGRGESRKRSETVNLIVTGDRTLRRLNREFRNKDKTTDVLSFVYPPLPESSLIGEVYISSDRTIIQAKEYGHSAKAELLRLTCHGVLHLLGYDHKTKAQTEQMRALEKTYLARINNSKPR